VFEDKQILAKQLEKLRDKQRAYKSKYATLEDKNMNLNKLITANKERHEKQQAVIKKKSFEIDELKLAMDELQKDRK